MSWGFVGLYLYTLAVGLTAAALVATGSDVFLKRRASFQTPAEGLADRLVQFAVVVVAGPYIILRNLIAARRVERRPFPFIFAGAALAALWCFCSGVVFLSIAERFA